MSIIQSSTITRLDGVLRDINAVINQYDTATSDSRGVTSLLRGAVEAVTIAREEVVYAIRNESAQEEL